MANFIGKKSFRRGFGIMAMAILLLVISASLVFGADAKPVSTLQLRPSVVVSGNMVTFSDLFFNAGPQADLVVANAPLPGRRLALSPSVVSRLATANGRRWSNTAQLRSIIIKREGRRLSASDLSRLLKMELNRTGNGAQFELVVSSGASNIFVPVETVDGPQIDTLEVNPASGAFVASLIPYPDAEPVTLRGRAWQLSEVPALNHAMRSGEIIGADDIHWVALRSDRLGLNPVTHEEDLIGKAARRSLRADRVLRLSDLKTPDMVKKGELISIVYQLPGLKLTARGKVLANAGEGETIRVINLQSNRTIEATIIGPAMAVVVPTQIVGG